MDHGVEGGLQGLDAGKRRLRDLHGGEPPGAISLGKLGGGEPRIDHRAIVAESARGVQARRNRAMSDAQLSADLRKGRPLASKINGSFIVIAIGTARFPHTLDVDDLALDL
jgi:hypothetical protein